MPSCLRTRTDHPIARYVNPMIGTGATAFNIGSALPGATAPFGLVKISPDTTDKFGAADFTHCAGYNFEDTMIYGFSHNHLHGTGAPDYGNLAFVPTIGMTDAKTTREGYKAPITHEGELASVGYYTVALTGPAGAR